MVVFENVAIRGKDLREIYDTRNSRNVVDLIVRNKLEISRESILKMHRMLVKDTEVRSGYKQFPNFILGRNIHTTLPEHVEEEMDKLIGWYSSQKGKIHPIKIAALFHGKFERIHPFEDGNGRVGRFLINTILANNRYPPIIIRKSQRVSYLHALESYDNGHPELLERYLLSRFKDTFSKFFEVYWKYIPQ